MAIDFTEYLENQNVFKSFEQLVKEIIELLANPTEEFEDVPF